MKIFFVLALHKNLNISLYIQKKIIFSVNSIVTSFQRKKNIYNYLQIERVICVK